jgi:hypothetical protein
MIIKTLTGLSRIFTGENACDDGDSGELTLAARAERQQGPVKVDVLTLAPWAAQQPTK